MDLVRLLSLLAGFGFALVGIVGTAAYVIGKVASSIGSVKHARAASYYEKAAKLDYERAMEGGRR